MAVDYTCTTCRMIGLLGSLQRGMRFLLEQGRSAIRHKSTLRLVLNWTAFRLAFVSATWPLARGSEPSVGVDIKAVVPTTSSVLVNGVDEHREVRQRMVRIWSAKATLLAPIHLRSRRGMFLMCSKDGVEYRTAVMVNRGKKSWGPGWSSFPLYPAATWSLGCLGS